MDIYYVGLRNHFFTNPAKNSRQFLSIWTPLVCITAIKCRASQKKLSALPGADGCHDGGGGTSMPSMGGNESCSGAGFVGVEFCVISGGRWSCFIHSSVTLKKRAILLRQDSSGVRIALSHGDHCWGDTPNAFAHFVAPPLPGYVFILHVRILWATTCFNSIGILPIWWTPFLGSRCPFAVSKKGG